MPSSQFEFWSKPKRRKFNRSYEGALLAVAVSSLVLGKLGDPRQVAEEVRILGQTHVHTGEEAFALAEEKSHIST